MTRNNPANAARIWSRPFWKRGDLRHEDRRVQSHRQPVLRPLASGRHRRLRPGNRYPSGSRALPQHAGSDPRLILPGPSRVSMALSLDQRLKGRKVVAVACFDSFGKTAMTMLAACRKQGADTELQLLQLTNRALSRRQRLEIQRTDRKTPIRRRPWYQFSALANEIADDTDVLILGLDGQRSRDALLQLAALWEGRSQRPMLVSAYPGLLFRFALEGMLDRSGADLLCLNSEQDLATYRMGRQAQDSRAITPWSRACPCCGTPIRVASRSIHRRSCSLSNPRSRCTRCNGATSAAN